MTGTGVIRLTESDWRLFAALRLRALADSVGNEDAQYLGEVGFTGTQWRRRLRAHAQFAFVEGDAGADTGGDTRTVLGLIAAQRPNTESVYLYSLWTDPLARGRGVARTLMSAAIDWARDQGASTVTLRVDQANDAARAVYDALGFTVSDQTATPANPAPAGEVIMSLNVS
ncbi:GNAT family N-acetyltransferase [Mycobacterium sp. OTB74]|jgi:ribosomal protein S18 acetylase RimI-like enzyme|uniref:GNAT family N-acetyltransferase n=1 Tax=Mycobacterium sp. OTB74 TaxID=1853452 RepID=UPI0024766229|nr:GNAT family N-acetyltransferase [Mycobacterium sp. OTB74]MDH6244228.1 ribosomal protein S18 acetylase RimI-like enzyme [Mycobacterium sp. OTB74]